MQPQISVAPACEAHFFNVTLNYPLQFAGVKQGTVIGTLSYFSLSKILMVVGLILAFLFALSRTLLARLMRELNDRIIAPVLTLSKGGSCSMNSDDLPTEVRQIQENIDALKTEILEKERIAFDLSKSKEIAELASHVAHDIRSPVTALAMLAFEETDLPEEKRTLLRSAVTRIQDIANDLLLRRRKLLQGVGIGELKGESSHLVTEAIESIISEKRTEYHSRHGIQIESQLGPRSHGLFVKVDLSDFKRILSNLINNSVDAIHENGRVVVSAKQEGPTIQIVIEDNGKGIPEDLIPILLEEGATFDKASGHGLGLSPAKNRIQDWGGQLRISSKTGTGTRVTIELPAAPTPPWFAPRLEIAPLSSVVICDDDITIHHIWDDRLKTSRAENAGIEVKHVSHEAELKQWHSKHHKPSTLYLVDYELSGGDRSGLDLINDLGVETQAVLVTSRSEESAIIEKCVRLGIRLLPKSSASWVPLVIRERAGSVDGILIEDDEALGIAWKTSAETRGKRLQVFRSPAPFLSIAHSVDRATPVYIDSNLGVGEKGEEIAKRLHAMGFENLYLTTGDPIEHCEPWLKGVLDKTPPWLRKQECLSG